MNFRRVAAAMILSCSLTSVAAPLVVGVKSDNKETAEAAQEETEEQLSIEDVLATVTVEQNNAPIVTAQENESKKLKAEKIEYKTGYISATKLNVRNKPSTKSDVVDTLGFNEKVKYYEYNGKWACLKSDKDERYISLQYISDKKATSKTFAVPNTSGKKTWMPHTKSSGKSIFHSASKQYKLQQMCYTGAYGIRQYDGRFCVALGSYFGCDIGQYFDLVLANGTVIPCVMADQKADKHTDANNIVTVHSGCMSEFICDRAVLNSNARRDGNISSCTKEWDSKVVQVIRYDKGVWND